MMQKSKCGFSLVEMAVVLVIIGLLAGAVTGGAGLIRSAELRRVVSGAKSYQFAVKQFEKQYGALPGDMPNATAVWGRADGVAGSGQCANPAGNSDLGLPTCNGSGDGIINSFSVAFGGLLSFNHEALRAWEHLSAAGYIAGDYTGINASASVLGINAKPGLNVPGGVLPKSAFLFSSAGMIIVGTDASYFEGDYNAALVFSKIPTVAAVGNAVVSAQQAYEVDRKIDDENPATGLLRSFKSTAVVTSVPNCVNAAGAYNVSYQGDACVLIFMMSPSER